MPRPRTRSNIGRHTRRSRHIRYYRQNRTAEQRTRDNEIARLRVAYLRSQESEEQRHQRLQVHKLRYREKRKRLADADKLNRQRITIQNALARSLLNHLAVEYGPENMTIEHITMEIKRFNKGDELTVKEEINDNQMQIGLDTETQDDVVENIPTDNLFEYIKLHVKPEIAISNTEKEVKSVQNMIKPERSHKITTVSKVIA